MNPTPIKRCLIADDVRTSRELLARWLREVDIACDVATDGEQAWKMIRQAPPHLVITDLDMPRCSGLGLIERVRHAEEPLVRAVPFLVVTSLHDQKLKESLLEIGANGLLRKPLEKTSVRSAVLELLAGGRGSHTWVPEAKAADPESEGAVSPTLRRLLIAVSKHESKED